MSKSRWTNRMLVFSSVLALTAVGSANAAAESADEPAPGAGQEVVISDATDFTVPEGDAATILAFVEKIANPEKQFSPDELQQYLDQVSTAIGTACDTILADQNDKTTDRQVIDAVEWKIESLRIREKLGDDDANKQIDGFLAGLKFDSRPEVQKSVDEIVQNRQALPLQMELMAKLRQWPRFDAAQRAETTDWLINAIKSGGASGSYASMLLMFCETLADTPDANLAQKALDELLPIMRDSDSTGVAQRLPLLEGIDRRLHLVGNKLELSGTLFDGAKIDWESYRGKVVLVDFWATWCGPCRAEVPNILENYLKYRDKGFEVIGISLDDKRSDAEEYVKQTNIPWPTLFHEASDENGWENPMAIKYGITGIPTAILVDQEGKVVSMKARGRHLGEALRQLLGEPSGGDASAIEISDQVERTARSDSR